jgi:hypothetical protein
LKLVYEFDSAIAFVVDIQLWRDSLLHYTPASTRRTSNKSPHLSHKQGADKDPQTRRRFHRVNKPRRTGHTSAQWRTLTWVCQLHSVFSVSFVNADFPKTEERTARLETGLPNVRKQYFSSRSSIADHVLFHQTHYTCPLTYPYHFHHFHLCPTGSPNFEHTSTTIQLSKGGSSLSRD